KTGGGALGLGSLSVGTLNISAGTVVFASASGNAARVKAISITSGAALDLTGGALVIDYDSTSPLATILSLIGGGGIMSSQSSPLTAIGYAEATELGISTFLGQSVDSTALLLRYTYYGDADLNSAVDTIDFNMLAANFSKTGQTWDHGDFNGDGNAD